MSIMVYVKAVHVTWVLVRLLKMSLNSNFSVPRLRPTFKRIMGRQDLITPDIVEWLASDDRVASRWKNLAERLGLTSYVDGIDADFSYRRNKFDRQKLKELLEVWRKASPVTFTRGRLVDALGREGLTDMVAWLQLMETEESRRKTEVRQLLDLSTSTPRSLSPRPSSRDYSLSSSPYSWCFGQRTVTSPPPGPCLFKPQLTFTPTRPKENGILKKRRPASEFLLTSDYFCQSSSLTSRESTPDSSSRARTIRFADDDVDVTDWVNKVHNRKGGYHDLHSSKSVERYFDNLITMIEEAAEGL